MLEGIKRKWAESGERVRLDGESEKLTKAMLWSEKGSTERQTAVDAYMEFARANLDYVAKSRKWKVESEEEKLVELEKLRVTYMEGEASSSGF